MRLTVLGSAASHAGKGQACAGHFLEAGGARVLFDCGNGVLANLYSVGDPYGLDAVFITHNHPDHYVDLYSMQSMLRYAPQGTAGPVALYTPGDLFERMQVLLSDRGGTEMREAFANVVLAPGESAVLGDLTVTPFAVEHTPPSFALVAEADGVRLCYTADTSPCDGVYDAARGVDLLVAEATLPEEYAGAAPHMTASQAGELARESGAGALVLVHVWPTNDRAEMARQAAEQFDGPVTVAREFDVFDVVTR